MRKTIIRFCRRLRRFAAMDGPVQPHLAAVRVSKRAGLSPALLPYASLCRQANQIVLLWKYKQDGHISYQYITKRENCETCSSRDRQVFAIAQAETGVNLPPMHPNCDCYIGILDRDGNITALVGSGERGFDLLHLPGNILRTPGGIRAAQRQGGVWQPESAAQPQAGAWRIGLGGAGAEQHRGSRAAVCAVGGRTRFPKYYRYTTSKNE